MTKKSVLLVLVLLAAVVGPASARQANGQTYGEIILTAVDATTGETLPGACYSVVGQPFCDDNYDGVVGITAVPPGEYVITEWLAPTGYELVAPFSIFVDPTYPAESNIHVQHFPLTGGEAPATEVPAPPTVTEVPLADFAYYESPNWGYVFSWDTNKWSVTDESSENGVDRLLIAGSEGSVELLGGQAYSGDPATCLTTAEQSIWTEPDVMNVQGATDGTYDFAYSDDWNAGNTFQIDYTDGQAQLWKIDCYQLAPGAEVLRITVVGSFEQFDLYWNDLVNISTDVAFPRRSFTGIDASDGYLTGAGTGCPSQPYPPRPLRDGAGFEVGMVTWYRWADLNSRPLAVLILENTSAVDLTIDALQFQLVVLDPRTKAEITSIPVTQFEWLNSAGNEFDPVQSIGPGSRSILGLGFQFSSGPDQYLHFDINYLGLDPVNSLVAKLDPAGCGAAGGRGKPVKA